MPFFASAQQLYGAGVGYVNGVPTFTPNISQKASELCVSLNRKMLYLWNRDSSEWKPIGGITVSYGAPIAAPETLGGTRTAINMQNGLIYWWNGTAWKEIIAYSVELANIYSVAVAELYANQVRAELADSTATLRAYTDSLHLADNDRDSTNELQNLVLLGTVLNITPGGNAVDFASLFAGYLLRSDTATLVSTKYYTKTNPTTIAANYVAVSNGTNLGARNFFNSTAYAGVIGVPWAFPEWTTVGRPVGSTNRWGFNTTNNWIEGYLNAAGAYISPLQSSLTGGLGTASNLFYADVNGRATNAILSGTTASVMKWYVNTTGYSTTSGGVLELDNFFGTGKYGIYSDNSGFLRIDRINTATAAVTINSLNQVTVNVLNVENDGLVFTPSFSFSKVEGEQTGAYQPATNKLAFVTFRRERLRISNTGVSIAPQSIASDGTVADAGYSLHVYGTDGIGISRGTVAERPTIIASTTPYRYNTDSTALEYGESVGVWRQIATRAYARSISTWLKPALQAANVNITPTAQRTLSFKRTKLSVSTDVYDSTGVGKIIIQPDTTIALNIFSIRNAEMGQSLLQFGGGKSIGFRGLNYTGRKQFWNIERVNLINSTILPLYGEQGAAQSFSIGESKIDFIGDLANSALSRIRFQTGNQGSNTYSQPLTLYENGTTVVGWGNPAYYGRKSSSTITNFLPPNFPDQAFMVGDTCTECSTLAKVTFVHDPNDSTFIKGNIRFFSYGTSATSANALTKTESTRYAVFATDGTVVSSQIIRDTLVAVNTNFSVSTLLNTCQHLHVTTSLNILAPNDVTVTLPTPSATLRGKQVTVYNESDGSYLLSIGVTGGASTLYYTTSTLATNASDQASLNLDGTTWPCRGASYTFTCKLLSGGYRWVLEQR